MATLAHVILGQGLTSQATARYWLNQRQPVRILSHQSNRLPKDLEPLYTTCAKNALMYWLSPGIHPGNGIYKQLEPEVPQLLDVEFFLWHTTAKVIGITGTNGKSTVCHMIAQQLGAKGYKVGVFGNFQPGLLTAIDGYDWVIIELSSFMLHYLPTTLAFEAVAITNIDVDHLSWHGSIETYQSLKKKVINWSDIMVADLPNCIPSYTEHHLTDAKNQAITETVLHQLSIDYDSELVLERLPFRAQCEHHIINDSKATNLHATYHALQSALAKHQKITLILAGLSKGDDPTQLMALITKNKVDLMIIGTCHQGFSTIPHQRFENMETCLSQLDLTSVILFSPGGSSYDQYEDYAARGRHFETIINHTMERT